MRIMLCALAALLLAGMAKAAEEGLVALDEQELSSINAQQGILLNLNLRNNVSASNTPIGCTVAVGTPNPCRVGLEFAARNGVWLMLKEFYGTLQLNDLRLDVALLPSMSTGYQDTTRFQDTSGGCLIASCNPNGKTAIKLTFPGTDTASTYSDFLSFLNIGRLWLEFDTAAPVTPGYMRDTTLNSAAGMRLSDSSALNASARMRFLGTAYVYGF